MGLEPLVTVGRLSTGISREPVEVFPAHFPGSGNGAARVQVQGNQGGLPKVPLPYDLHGVMQVLVRVQGTIFFNHICRGNSKLDSIGSHHAGIRDSQSLVVARAHDEGGSRESLPPFSSQFDLGNGWFCGRKAILQSVGGDDETIRLGGRVIWNDPLFFEGESHERNIANIMHAVKQDVTLL